MYFGTNKQFTTISGFNRTFMELKCKRNNGMGKLIYSFNRTFMELKSPKGDNVDDETKLF